MVSKFPHQTCNERYRYKSYMSKVPRRKYLQNIARYLKKIEGIECDDRYHKEFKLEMDEYIIYIAL